MSTHTRSTRALVLSQVQHGFLRLVPEIEYVQPEQNDEATQDECAEDNAADDCAYDDL